MDEIDVNQAYKRLGDQPMMLHIIGAGTVLKAICERTINEKTLRGHVMRRAFMSWDDIRTGKISRWTCGLCNNMRSGLEQLSCLVVVETVRGKPRKKKPCFISPICVQCDKIDKDETGRRIAERFGFPSYQQIGHG